MTARRVSSRGWTGIAARDRTPGHRAASTITLVVLLLGLLTALPAPAVQAAEPALTSVTVGNRHACALRGAQVWCWGDNDRGQLGSATPTEHVETPVRVPGISTATAVTAGAAFTCALLAAGTVRCWGAGNTGQLGNGSSEDSTVPVAVTGLSGITQVAAGRAHACAMDAVLVVSCWGSNGNGQLASGSVNDAEFYMNTMTLAQQAAGANSLAVTPSGSFSVADQSGYIWSFGDRGTNIDRYGLNVGGSQPKPLAVVAGTTYFAIGSALLKIPAGGTASQFIRDLPGSIAGLAGDDLGGGHLYVSYGGNRVAKFAVGDLVTPTWDVPVPTPETPGFEPPTLGGDIAWGVNPDNPNGGNLFLTFADPDRVRAVVRFSSGTGEVLNSFLPFTLAGPCTPSLAGLGGASRVGTDADGNVWVSGNTAERASGGYCVDAFSPGGSYITSWRDPLLTSDYGFDVAGLPDGSLLIADAQNQRVLRAVPGDDLFETDTSWGDVPFSLTPRRAVPLSSFFLPLDRLEAGGDHTCYWRASTGPHTSFTACAGDNGAGEIDDALPRTSTSFPVLFDGFATETSSLGVGAHHICAANDAKTGATCRGDNAYGQTGGGNLQVLLQAVPQSIHALDLGRTSTCVTTGNAQVYCLGELPMLGDGCYYLNENGSACFRSPVRSLDGSASGGAPEGVITGATSTAVAGDSGCLTYQDASIHCWTRPRDNTEKGMAEPVSFPPASRATVTPGSTVADPVVVTFPDLVGGITGQNLVLQELGGAAHPVTQSCRGDGEASTSCDGDSVRSVRITPSVPLVSGRAYEVVTNPAGSSPLTDAQGPLATDAVGFTGPARQEESGPALTYRWATATKSSAKAFGKSYAWSNTPGATISTTFRGKSVTWYGQKGRDGGKVRVLIDGKRKADLSMKASSAKWKVPFTLKGLGGGKHRLTLVVRPTKSSAPEVAGKVALDAIKVGSKVTRNPLTVDTWGRRSNPQAGAGAYAVSHTPGSSVTFTFDGGGLIWSTLRTATSGSAALQVDGTDQGNLDLSGVTVGYVDVPVPLAGPGPHTVRLTVGPRSGSAVGLTVDAFTAEEN